MPTRESGVSTTKTLDTRPRSVRPLRIRSRNSSRLGISADSSGMAETHPVGRIHPGGQGHLNAAEMTEITEATDNQQGTIPPEGTTTPGRPIGEVTERLSTL